MPTFKHAPRTVRRAKILAAAKPLRSSPAATGAQRGDDALLLLQRTIGNRAVQQLLRQPATHSGSVGSQAGSLRGPAAAPNAGRQSPIYVSFVNDLPPAAPDHSQANPGPGGATADRAGYSRARIRKRMVIAWDTGPATADGRVPLFAQSVNVYFQLADLQLAVSSDYAEGSCPYAVTLAHERSHIAAFSRIFHAGRAPLVRDLEAVPVPTATAPTLVDPAAADAEQEKVAARLSDVIKQHSADIKAAQDADRAAKDSPAAYAAVHAQCPTGEW